MPPLWTETDDGWTVFSAPKPLQSPAIAVSEVEVELADEESLARCLVNMSWNGWPNQSCGAEEKDRVYHWPEHLLHYLDRIEPPAQRPNASNAHTEDRQPAWRNFAYRGTSLRFQAVWLDPRQFADAREIYRNSRHEEIFARFGATVDDLQVSHFLVDSDGKMTPLRIPNTSVN